MVVTDGGGSSVTDVGVLGRRNPVTPDYPPHPADVAQARRFVSILRLTHADLQAQLGALEACAPRERSSELADQLRAQCVEVSGLLAALERRFAAHGRSARGAA